MAAAMQGHTDAVKLLLERGANVHEKNERGETALTIPESKGHPEIIRILKEAGAQ